MYLLIILHIHHRVDHVLSSRNTLFALIRNVMFSVPLCCIEHTLLGSNFEYGAVAWNSTASSSVNEVAGILQKFLSFVIIFGAFAKLRKATISFIMSVRSNNNRNNQLDARIVVY